MQIDFKGLVINERNKKRYIGTSVDIFSKWPIRLVYKTCRLNAQTILASVCENLWPPKTKRLDKTASTAVSSEASLPKRKSINVFVTSYLHIANGCVEHARTIQDYTRTF